MYNRYVPAAGGFDSDEWRTLEKSIPPRDEPPCIDHPVECQPKNESLLHLPPLNLDTIFIIAIALFLLCDHLDGIWDVLIIVAVLLLLGF